MRRAGTMLLAALLAAAFGVSAAQASRHHGRSAGTATVELRTTKLGAIVVDGAGFTLYEFTHDKKNKDTCMTISGCSSVWPALTVSGTPTAGAGVEAKKLSTITLSGGAHQVTYNGHPLYTYTGDSAPGETGYVGADEFGGHWYALNAKAKPVK